MDITNKNVWWIYRVGHVRQTGGNIWRVLEEIFRLCKGPNEVYEDRPKRGTRSKKESNDIITRLRTEAVVQILRKDDEDTTFVVTTTLTFTVMKNYRFPPSFSSSFTLTYSRK